jgi:hypothetical protein
MQAAAMLVCEQMVTQLAKWQGEFNDANARVMANTDEPLTPACPLFGGLLMSLCNILLYEDNFEHVLRVADELNGCLQPEVRAHLRRRINEVFDRMGLVDDTHLFNYLPGRKD